MLIYSLITQPIKLILEELLKAELKILNLII